MDPVLTPIFVGVLVKTFGVAAATAEVWAPVITAFVLAAGAVLLSILLAPKPPRPEDGKVVLQTSIPPRQYGYGRAMVAGAMMFQRPHPDGGHEIYQVQALVSHRVHDFVRFFYNDDRLSTEPYAYFQSRVVLRATPNDDGRYEDEKCILAYRYGLEEETPYSFINGALGDDMYPETNLGNGIASLANRWDDAGPDHHATRFPFGVPQPSALLDLALLYDPRDPAQDRADPETWVYSRNSALCILHYLCLSEFGFRRDYERAILPVEDDWIEQIDICDELVGLVTPGDDQARYELGGVGNTENDPQAILTRMLASCDGWIVYRGDGSVVLRVGKWQPSGVAIEKEDITGFAFQRGMSDEEVINRLQINFVSPDHDYAEVECDPWEDVDDQTMRGHTRDTTYDLTWVQDYRRARRIAKREFKRLREPVRGTLDLKLSAINACYERFIYLGDTGIPGLSNRYVENRSARFMLAAGGLRMEFLGADESIDDWTATIEDEGLEPPLLDGTGSSGLYVPFDLTATVENFSPAAGVTAQRIVLEFDAPAVGSDPAYRSRWYIKDINPAVAGDQFGPFHDKSHTEPPVEVSPGRVTLKTDVVDADEVLYVTIATEVMASIGAFANAVIVYTGTATPPEGSLDYSDANNSQYLVLMVP